MNVNVTAPNDERETTISITIELAPEIEQIARAKAEARGISVD